MLAVGFKDRQREQLCYSLSEKVDGPPDWHAHVANKPQHANEGQATQAALRSPVKSTWTGPGGCDGANVRAPDRKEQILGRPADFDLCF